MIVDGQVMARWRTASAQPCTNGCVSTARPAATVTYGDYLLPSTDTMPRMRRVHMETPTPLNPLGVRRGRAVQLRRLPSCRRWTHPLSPFGVRIRGPAANTGAIATLIRAAKSSGPRLRFRNSHMSASPVPYPRKGGPRAWRNDRGIHDPHAGFCTRLDAARRWCGTSGPGLPEQQVRRPAAAPGSFDVLARIVAPGLGERWPQRVLVDNKAGGAGNIGAREVAKADPDGYTLLTWNDTLLINPTLFQDLPVDPKRDFVPCRCHLFAERAGGASVGQPEDLWRLPTAARANPGKLNYGSPGTGSPGHLSSELFKRLATLDIVHVPVSRRGPGHYRPGGGPDPARHGGYPGCYRSHQVRYAHAACGHLTRSRQGTADCPDHRRGRRAGLSDQCLPRHPSAAGTPKEIIAQLEKDITDVIKSPEVNQKLIDLGFRSGRRQRRGLRCDHRPRPAGVARRGAEIRRTG